MRSVDNTFKTTTIKLPEKNGCIDYDFMENFVAELEAFRVEELKSYLSSTGLNDYTLTKRKRR